MRFAFAVALFLLLPAANAGFLVGNGTVGQKIFVLCEGNPEIFVSQPSGVTERMALGSDFQAFFVPGAQGPHAVQCGKETKTAYAFASAETELEESRGGDLLATLSLAVALGGFLLATLLAAKFLILDRSDFRKIVGGGKVKLQLRMARRVGNAVVHDPVCAGFAGKEMVLNIGRLPAGKAWEFEYEADGWEERHALPASLSFEEKGRKMQMLSELFIEGKGRKQEARKTGAGTLAKRKLPKASP